MRKNIVFTLTGPDQIGIVEAVTKLLLEHGGNVETSRMVRLGGEFAMLVLVSMPEEQLNNLDSVVAALAAQGYKASASQTEQAYAERYSSWLPFHIEVQGTDHEGIIHHIARVLSQSGINIESMDTGISRAPMSGTPLFNMDAIVLVPPSLKDHDWQDVLEEIGHQMNVDITFSKVSQ